MIIKYHSDKIALVFLLTFLLLLLWSGVSYSTDSHFFPTPMATFDAFAELLLTGELGTHISSSLTRVAIGFLIGISLALALACVSFFARPLRHAINFYVDLARSIPPIALIPFAILWFGIGTAPALFLVGFASFFPTYTSALGGLLNVPLEQVQAAKTLGSTKMQLGSGPINWVSFCGVL